MQKFLLKTIRKFLLASIVIIALFTILLNVAFYYDTLSLIVITIPCLIIVRLLDDYMRDTIIIIRDDETVLATILTLVILFACMVIAYLIFVNLLNQKDLVEMFVNLIGRFVNVNGLKNFLGI